MISTRFDDAISDGPGRAKLPAVKISRINTMAQTAVETKNPARLTKAVTRGLREAAVIHHGSQQSPLFERCSSHRYFRSFIAKNRDFQFIQRMYSGVKPLANTERAP